MTEKDWIAFLQRLSDSQHRVAAAYGRFGLVMHQWRHRNRLKVDRQGLEKLHANIHDLMLTFKGLKFVAPSSSPRSSEALYRHLSRLRDSVKRELRPALATNRATSDADRRPRGDDTDRRPRGDDTDRSQWKIHGYPRTTGRLRFEPVRLRIRTLDGKNEPFNTNRRWQGYSGWGPAKHFLRCGNIMDVMWDNGVVIAMREKGVFEELIAKPEPIIEDVVWDERWLWVGTSAGLQVFDPKSGKLAFKVDQNDNLPPADRRIRLYAIAPGQVFAAGSFGEKGRSWCAMIDYADGETKVNVFHRATRIPRRSENEMVGDDPAFVFVPDEIYEATGGESSPRALLLQHSSKKGNRKMLRINLETLDVSAVPKTDSVHDIRSPHAYYLPNGEVLEARYVSAWHWAPAGKTWKNGTPSREFCTNVTRTTMLNRKVLEFDGQLYLPGRRWYRIDPRTMEEEMLVPGMLPLKYSSSHFDISAHFGLIAWDTRKGSFYRVTIADTDNATEGR